MITMLGMYCMGIHDDKVKIRYIEKDGGPEVLREITSIKDYAHFLKGQMEKLRCELDDLCIMCSSSMDFPEDSTDNKKTIKLAHELR